MIMIWGFGLAKVEESPDTSPTRAKTLLGAEDLTSPGQALGTVAYHVTGAGAGKGAGCPDGSVFAGRGAV